MEVNYNNQKFSPKFGMATRLGKGISKLNESNQHVLRSVVKVLDNNYKKYDIDIYCKEYPVQLDSKKFGVHANGFVNQLSLIFFIKKHRNFLSRFFIKDRTTVGIRDMNVFDVSEGHFSVKSKTLTKGKVFEYVRAIKDGLNSGNDVVSLESSCHNPIDRDGHLILGRK